MDTEHDGWKRSRDGMMADYTDMEVGYDIEPYDPDKDPVNKGLTSEQPRGRHAGN